MNETHFSDDAAQTCTDPSRILVLHINDSSDDQVLLQAASKHAGVPVEWHVAESVKRGISYLQSLVQLGHKHTVHWIDLVILDLLFHDGSGMEIIKYIRNTPEISSLPIVILTGHMNPATLQDAENLGANAIHEKPVSFEDTVKLVTLIYQNWSTSRHQTA